MATKNKRMRSVMKHDFSRVPDTRIPRSNFNRSHGYKTTLSSGYLVPIYIDEALPGDTFKLNLNHVTRLATPLVPFMDNVYMSFFFFAVPNRLVWKNWERFMGEQDNPTDSIDYLVPTVTAPAGGFAINSLADYFGLPVLKENITPNALHFRAHNLIYNDWFRSQDLQDSKPVNRDSDGPDNPDDYKLYKRTKRYDYFTSALPWPQKSNQAVEVPIGDKADIKYDVFAGLTNISDYFYVGRHGGTDWRHGYDSANQKGSFDTDMLSSSQFNLYADLATATAPNVSELREAFQLQRMLERDARGGTRYREIILSHFKTDTGDTRLMRPEYLGGGRTPLQVTPIPQTSEAGTTPQGKLAAVGYASGTNIGFTKSFVEHSVVIGYVCVHCDLTYQNSLHRMWTRQTKYDFYWPALAFLGEQAILRQEIDCTSDKVTNETAWGYNERWSELRYPTSRITGKMRSVDPQSLDYWHLSQDLVNPQLNSDFIEENPPIQRVIAVTSEPEFVYDSYISLIQTRPIPSYSVPGMIDHF